MAHAQKPVVVQAFIPDSSMKAFDKRVVHRFSRSAEIELYAVLPCPVVQYFSRKLGVITKCCVLKKTKRQVFALFRR
jgi:hypothetical protein